VNGEPIPEQSALLLAEVNDQRLAAVDIQIIHLEVDGLGLRVVFHDAPHLTSELAAGTIGCGGGEVPAGLWFHGAEYIRRAAPRIFVVLLGRFPGFGWARRAHVRMQRHRFLVYANYGFGRIAGLLIDGQHVFHVPDVCLVQLRHTPVRTIARVRS
jgi:hypothetical protein